MSSLPRGLKLGSTLFSFTNEYHSREYSFEQLLAEVARRGLGPGLEIVGFQSIKGFPTVTDAFADRFRELMSIHKLTPSCFSINGDMMLKRGTMMSIDEAVAYHELQLKAAAKLGFPVARCQFAAPAEVIRRLVPLAEKLDLKLGPEIHAPLTVDSPQVLAYREMYAKVGSPCLGFIPDFGTTARRVPEPYLDTLRKKGIAEHLIATAVEIWRLPSDSIAKRNELAERLRGQKVEPTTFSALAVMFNILSANPPTVWREIMPQVIHIHGKFYDFDSEGNECAIPYDELLRLFVEDGYNGFMSSEWEGHMYSSASAFDLVAKHHALCRRILGTLSGTQH